MFHSFSIGPHSRIYGLLKNEQVKLVEIRGRKRLVTFFHFVWKYGIMLVHEGQIRPEPKYKNPDLWEELMSNPNRGAIIDRCDLILLQ